MLIFNILDLFHNFLEQTNDFTEIIMQYPTNLSTLSTLPFREPYVSRCGTVRFA